VSITKTEKKKYVLSTKKDYEILEKIKKLEKTSLTKEEKHLIKLIRTQLEKNWRKPLLKMLDKLLQKHSKQ